MSADDAVKCTKCGSTQVHAEKRGFRLTTGFIGSSKIYITCLKCGNRFRPGDSPKYSALSVLSEEGQHDMQVGCLALAVVAVVGFVLMKACS